MAAVTAGDIGCAHRFLLPVRLFQPGFDPAAGLCKSHEPGAPLDPHAKVVQFLFEQDFMFVLREDKKIRECADIGSGASKPGDTLLLLFDPEMKLIDMTLLIDKDPVDLELPVKFERSGLYNERAGGRTRLGGLVDDAERCFSFGKPERKYETGGARAANKHRCSV